MRRIPALLALLLVVVLAGCTADTSGSSVGVGREDLDVEVAETVEERRRGLMSRESLPKGQGMLFVFPEEGQRDFWMKNMSFPIDIIYIDRNKTIVDIKRSVPPCSSSPCTRYRSSRPAKYVLETREGFSKTNGIEIGGRVKFDLGDRIGD